MDLTSSKKLVLVLQLQKDTIVVLSVANKENWVSEILPVLK